MKMILPSQLRQCLINKGYNDELSAGYIATTYLMVGFEKHWDKQTKKDLKECVNQLETI